MWEVLTARVSATDTAGQGVRIERDRPSLPEVADLFERLCSGQGGDLFVSGQPGDRCLMVAGGPSHFLVSCVGEGYGAHNLVDPAAENRGEWMELIAGGVPSAVEVAATVGRGLALQAIRYFHGHGAIDPELRWV